MWRRDTCKAASARYPSQAPFPISPRRSNSIARDDRSFRRRPPVRAAKRRFVVFCEGKNTEPAYFEALGRAYAAALVEVKVVAAVGAPYTIAERAVGQSRELKWERRRANSFEQADEVWAVFDRDDHPRYDDAIGLCRQAGVRVGRSDPCFELWLILHEADFDGPEGRELLQARLQRLRPEYDPRQGKTPNCTDLVARVEAAETRASAQLAKRDLEQVPFGRPSTTVGQLTEVLRKAAEASRMR